MRLKEDQILNRLALRSGLKEGRLRERLTELRRFGHESSDAQKCQLLCPVAAANQRSWKTGLGRKVVATDIAPGAGLPRRDSPENHPRTISLSSAPGDFFASVRALAEAGVSPTFERLMLEFDDLGMKNLVSELDDNERRSVPRGDLKKDLRDLLKAFREAVPQPRNELDLESLLNLVEQREKPTGYFPAHGWVRMP